MNKNKSLTFSVWLMILFYVSSNFAQTTTSTIEGTVTDSNGAVISGATIKATGTTLGVERTATSDKDGFYRLVALPAGTYSLTFTQNGFASKTSTLELTLNKIATFNVQLQIAGKVEQVDVTSEGQLLETNEASVGLTVTPKQITELPVNGRNYLDLLQLVPGVAVNRQADPKGDNATPTLGERGGNTNFFIDGHPNKDTVNGGPAAQFNQETIAEFQVLTTGYKAEFGQASGAIVNVITKSGGNQFHGVGSLFLRNDGFDGVNSLKTTITDALPLTRYDYSIAGGGPIVKDKFFFFASSERITENRQIDFTFPDTGNATVNTLLRNQENPFDTPALTRETRNFIKLNQNLGNHQLSQEFNYTNSRIKNYLPLAQSQSLPSARNNLGSRSSLFAFGDTVLLGNQSNPYIVNLRAAFRGEPSNTEPAHPEITGSTLFNPYSGPGSFLFGDLPTVTFGNPNTPSNLNQKYVSLSANVSKLIGNHDFKFGWSFLRTKVDGVETRVLQNQLFATATDFSTFGAATAGVYLLAAVAGATPQQDEIHLLSSYNGLYVQDDWKIRNNLSVNLGIRWDYDSEFRTKKNFGPRLGVVWSITPKTVLRANMGVFYDQFRLGLVRNIPAFGGTDRRGGQIFVFPRLLYGSPSYVSSIALLSGLPGGCFQNLTTGNLTDAQVAGAGAAGICPFTGAPFIGVDRLNRVVAPGHALIPANTVVTSANVQTLSGLTPQQYADQASVAIGQPAGYFTFGSQGLLQNQIIAANQVPIGIDENFQTPHTLGFSIGVQRELIKDTVITADYFHREMRNLLGIRRTNLPFRARVVGRVFDPPFTAGALDTFGPWYEGKYDALIIGVNSRFAKRFVVGSSYSYANATDNSLGINTLPSDSFVGTVPVVTQGTNSNTNGSFTTTQGRFVAVAGQFYNGPDLDKGPSALALDHVFQVNGLVDLPWQFQISSIFRVQSGFHFTKANAPGATVAQTDPDGDSTVNGINTASGRNAFTAPPLTNLDLRFSKRFNFNERVKLQVLFEFFNILNRQNPAAVQNQINITGQPFGKANQVLPGREGQFGFRLEF
ncbi:MAG TPA: TonB-dependent receptor [Pyrinomonadaceae bacterium]|nr:TonB-dependent receptor [Pyrinomonadaceae bacterium]